MNVLSAAARFESDLDAAQAELARLRTEVASLRARQTELWHAAGHDELTGLVNRRLFFSLAGALLGTGRPTVVIALDLNGFKPINDTYGHEAGDRVLQAVGKRLVAVADGELPTGNVVARLGGDEFTAILTSPYRQCAPQWWRRAVAALSTAIAQPVPIGAHRVTVTAAIGIAYVYDNVVIDELLRRADFAMYHAKTHGTGFAVWGVDTGDGRDNADRARPRGILRDQDGGGQAVTASTSRVVELAIFPSGRSAGRPAERISEPQPTAQQPTAQAAKITGLRECTHPSVATTGPGQDTRVPAATCPHETIRPATVTARPARPTRPARFTRQAEPTRAAEPTRQAEPTGADATTRPVVDAIWPGQESSGRQRFADAGAGLLVDAGPDAGEGLLVGASAGRGARDPEAAA